MKPKPLLLSAGLGAALLALAFAPRPSQGQAGPDDAVLSPLIAEVVKQQALIAENQDKIDQSITAIAEDVRIARIFVGRGGGKTK